MPAMPIQRIHVSPEAGSASYLDIVVNPHGHLLLESTGTTPWPIPEAADRCATAFEKGPSALLLHLASRELDTLLPPVPAFWRMVARRYFTALCLLSESEITTQSPAMPDEAEWEGLLAQAPSMRGLEYLNSERMESIWLALAADGQQMASQHPKGPGAFLHALHPAWRAVGRVCFHLAQNKKNEAYPFAFMATYAPGVGTHGQVQYRPLGQALQEYAGKKNHAVLLKLLMPIHEAAKTSPLTAELFTSKSIYHPLAWTPTQAMRFLKDIPAIEAAGVRVRIPELWKNGRPKRARVNVRLGEERGAGLGLKMLLDFQIHVALDGVPLSKAEIAALLASTDGLALIRGQWVEVDAEKLKQALAHWEKMEGDFPDGLTLAEGLRQLSTAQTTESNEEGDVADWVGLRPGTWLEETLGALRDPSRLKAMKNISGLHAKLRPYQRHGVAWLAFMRELGLGACLADDMGLGKTIQLIALLLLRRLTPAHATPLPNLLVAPASLLSNWQAEIKRFAPRLRARILHPSALSSEEWKSIQAHPLPAIQNTDLVMTTYGMLPRWKALRQIDWSLVALDEAQAIKNPATRQTRAIKELHAHHRVALTGTPIENRLGDLWSLFDFLNPGLLGSATTFSKLAKSSNDPATITTIRTLTRPYILRRLKSDRRIISDLPDKTEVPAFCSLSKKQATLYAKSVEELESQLKEKDGMKRRGLILAYILRFKQICNHPSQWLHDGQFDPSASGKFKRLEELASEIASRQEKMLVFTQFREMTAPLEGFLSGIFRCPGLILHGGTPVKDRRKLVEAFQKEDGPPFFVLTTKAGGAGLNLTEASHVVHFDRWWNPAVENQATDRAFRIGQKRNVLVHKFVCQGTIEEKIDTMIADKSALAHDILGGAGTGKQLTEMNNQELIRFVSLDMNKATSVL